jgi:hypothetical protein
MQVLSQLVFQVPLILVYLAGMGMAGANLSRYGRAATFVLFGCGLLLLTMFGSAFVQSLILKSASGDQGRASLSQNLATLGAVSGLLHTLGIGLLIAGAFADRTVATGR